MKKYLMVICALMMCFAVAGCGNTEGTNKNNANSSAANEATTSNATTTKPETTTKEETTTTTAAPKIDPNRKTDIRKTCWGDSLEDVKSLEEKEPDVESDNLIAYDTTVNGAPTTICYYFNDFDQLYSILYLTDDSKGAQASQMILRYNSFVDLITEKYGSPTKNSKAVLNDLAKYCDSDAQALNLGYIAYFTEWPYNSRTDASMMMQNENYSVGITIRFKSNSVSEPASDPDI